MKITITHCQNSMDPAATIPGSEFPEFLDDLEKSYTSAITAEYPDANVWFVNAEPCGNGIDIDCADSSGDIAHHINEILSRVFEILTASTNF
jgi:hypothetical protein